MHSRVGMQSGFHHSRKRIVAEVLGVVAVLGLLVWGVLALAGTLAAAALPLVPPSVDNQLGETFYSLLAPESERCTSPEPKAYVDAVAKPLLEALGPSPFAFEFVVVDDDAINAFALPGGKMAVNIGLLRKASTGEEVAGVLAHELSHATQRHGLHKILEGLGGTAALGMLFGIVDVETLAAPAVALLHRAYSRDTERDADTVGRALLVKARIDPYGMAEFFRRLEAEHGDALPPALLSTHPDPGDRARAIAEGPEPEGPLLALPPPPASLPCRSDTDAAE